MFKEYVFVFKSTHDSISTEKLLIKNGISVNIMSLPEKINSGCGICIRIKENDLIFSIELLNNNEIDFEGIYLKTVSKEGTDYSRWKI